MKRAALLATLIAVAGACKHADAPNPQPTAAEPSAAPAAADPWQQKATAKDPLPHPLFWSAEKGGKTVYFLGTMHMGVDAESRLPALVWQKLDAAPAFAMETDINDPDLTQKMLAPQPTSIHESLGDADWKKIEDAIGAAAAARLDHLKPMVIASMLSVRGLPMTAPMDGVLGARATNEHKQIVFLEPAATEAAILEKWLDTRALKALVSDLAEGEQHAKEMLAAYIAGDDAKIVALGDGERADALAHGYTAAEYEQQMEDLLYHRNASWIPAIEQLHDAGGGFVAVGAMHLVGKRSVLELLAQAGYKITRLSP